MKENIPTNYFKESKEYFADIAEKEQFMLFYIMDAQNIHL